MSEYTEGCPSNTLTCSIKPSSLIKTNCFVILSNRESVIIPLARLILLFSYAASSKPASFSKLLREIFKTVLGSNPRLRIFLPSCCTTLYLNNSSLVDFIVSVK